MPLPASAAEGMVQTPTNTRLNPKIAKARVKNPCSN